MHGILCDLVGWYHWLLSNTFLPEDARVPGQHGLQQQRSISLWFITAQVVFQLYVLCRDLVEPLGQLGGQILISTAQQTSNLLCNPPIVQEALSGGGRQRRGKGQLVQQVCKASDPSESSDGNMRHIPIHTEDEAGSVYVHSGTAGAGQHRPHIS